MCIASHLVKRGKDKTVRKSTSLKRSIGTVIAKVLNCIPRFRIVCIDTTAFLFMVFYCFLRALGVRTGQPLYGIFAQVGWPNIGPAAAGPAGPVAMALY